MPNSFKSLRFLPSEVKRYSFKALLIFTTTSLFLYTAFHLSSFYSHVKGMEHVGIQYAKESSPIDYDNLCTMLSCETLYYLEDNKALNLVFTRNLDNNVHSAYLFNLGSVIFFKDGGFGITFKDPDGKKPVFRLHHTENLIYQLVFFFALLLVNILTHTYFLLNIAKMTKMLDLISVSGKEAQLVSRTMSLLMENIHHEVKTPLAVISSKVNFLRDYYEDMTSAASMEGSKRRQVAKGLLGEYVQDEGRSNAKIAEAFDLIETYVGSIYVVVERMRSFKQIKYSNGNKSVYDILIAAFSTMEMTQLKKFDFEIDTLLKSVHIHTLTNEDILHIFINHIKNSLEAQATNLKVTCDLTGVEDLGIGHISLADNGHGIPWGVRKNIFKPNFSTKGHKGDLRGVGLYISKALLNTANCDEHVVVSTHKGTTFNFSIPMEFRK